MIERTRDTLLRGRLSIAQPAEGYRTNVDALWLAAFAARGRVARHVLDLGAGVGVVALALVVCEAARAATLVDVDPNLVELARENAASAGLSGRVDARVVDLREPLPRELSHAFDLVVANPPWAIGETAASPHEARARARTADPETVPGFVRAARQALGAGGRACFVFPPGELSALFALLRRGGLEPKRLRAIHPLPDARARAVLIEAKPARPGGLRVEPPFVAMSAPGTWSEEASRILDGVMRPDQM